MTRPGVEEAFLYGDVPPNEEAVLSLNLRED